MQKFAQFTTTLLLIFNGIGAIYGGWNLMLYPDGSGIKLSPDLLEHTPFHDYLVPGLTLFIVNGIFSTIVLISILLKYSYQSKLIIVQGVILTGWILIQICLIKTVYFLHQILGTLGIALITLGWMQRPFTYIRK